MFYNIHCIVKVSISNRNTLTGEMGLRFAYSEFPKVKNTCGEDRIGLSRLENIGFKGLVGDVFDEVAGHVMSCSGEAICGEIVTES